MKTNEIKKGARIQLANGWYGTVADNMRGTTRMVDVEGHYREVGSTYSHDWVRVLVCDVWVDIEYTPAQNKLKKQLKLMGW